MKTKFQFLFFTALVIAFTTMASFVVDITDEEKKGLSKVQKVNDVEVYVMSEPLRSYEIVGTVEVYDAGISQNYIDDWMDKYVKKAIKLRDDGKTVDAVIYTSGKTATVIKWKQ